MRHIIKLSLVLFLLCGISYSCTKDKGNYDYKIVQEMNIKFPSSSVIVKLGDNFTVEPVFIDPKTEEELDFKIEDYSWKWYYGESRITYKKDYKLISSKYNLDEPLYFPVDPEPHIITLEVEELATGRIFFNHFLLRMVGKYRTTYAFLVEDDSGNVDLEFYGNDVDDNIIHEKNYLTTATEFPYTSGGANAIGYDAPNKRLYIATGSGMSWLTTPDFSFDPILNRLENIMLPKEVDTFAKMIRMGQTTTGPVERTFLCITEEGGLHIIAAANAMVASISMIGNRTIEVAPMVGGFSGQGVILLWNKTDKNLAWGSSYNQASSPMPRSLSLYDAHIPNITDCLFLGGSVNYEIIGVVKDNTEKYWRLDAWGVRPDPFKGPVIGEKRPPRELIGTSALGKIDHWRASLYKGYLYAVANNKFYTYVESQAGGGVVDPGWIAAKITDKDGAIVNITKPVSFIWNERCKKNPDTGLFYDYFHIVTYDKATGGTIYIVAPEETGQHLILVETIEGLGNVQEMCYWWG